MSMVAPSVSCLLLEDHASSRAMIEDIIRNSFPRITVHSCSNIAEAKIVFLRHRPSMLILDINLPDGNSFELLSFLYNEGCKDFKVVFITAYAAYAVQAFRFSALDFLLKPYTPQELVAVLEKAMSSIDDDYNRLRLETFFHNLQAQAGTDKKMVLRTQEDIHVVRLQEVLQAESDNNYTWFYLENGAKLLVSQPLKAFEKKLDAQGFMRVHQSHLVNLAHIVAYRKKTNMLVLNGDISVPVSQGRRAGLLAYLDKLS